MIRLATRLTALVLVLAVPPTFAQLPSTHPADGLRIKTPHVYALVGGRIVARAGQTIDSGTIVIRQGLIERIGTEVEIPPDAQRIDLSGRTIYPGLIDAWSEAEPQDEPAESGYWNPAVRPDRRMAEGYSLPDDLADQLRQQGITARLVAPDRGIIKGISALYRTGGPEDASRVIDASVALHIQLTPRGGRRGQYPGSPMGAVALVRQAFYDARWYRQARQAAEASGDLPRPSYDASLEALQPYVEGEGLVIIDAPDHQYFLRADRLAREFGLRLIVRGGGDEYQRLDAIRGTGRAVLATVDFPRPPDVSSTEAALDTPLEVLMHWDLAASNPRRLAEQGVAFALTTSGLNRVADFLPGLRRAVERGLSEDDALRAVTEVPASLLGVDGTHGSLAPGKSADLIVCDGNLFDKKSHIVETWVAGARYRHTPEEVPEVHGSWDLQWDPAREGEWQLVISGRPGDYRGKLEYGDKQAELKRLQVSSGRLTATVDAGVLDAEGTALLTLVFVEQEGQATARGQLRLPGGEGVGVRATRSKAPEGDAADSPDAHPDDKADREEEQKAEEENQEQEEEENEEEEKEEEGERQEASGDQGESEKDRSARADRAALAEVNYPLGAFGRADLPAQPEWLAVEHATIWTCGPEGVLEDATLLVHKGKIAAVGTGLEIPEGAERLDAHGLHLSPGIIDCHSHIATDGGINESTQAVTAEVRIGDFIDATDISIYRQLAGGVTSSNILHGSANPIGGQNQVIKLRWGALPEELKFRTAPPGIKFALGENVKQSNWGDEFTQRYPQTRMGVPEVVRDALQAAREYQRRWREWEEGHRGVPPRRDLELDALSEVLSGERLIHCHSYRQDEILALLRTLEDFGVRIGTLQHILEGYKVAEVLRAHGAMASTFADWWAYKFEVYDAIPYNGALMHHQGLVVSFNSDDAELARHLNQEAGKAVKYGDVEPEEALKFVTLNPARQLRIDAYVGSLEAGKDADFVLWSGPPLSTLSRCEQTWIEGRRYFDRQEDARLQEEALKLRWKLVQKILDSGKPMERAEDQEPRERDLWPRHDAFCGLHEGAGVDGHAP